MTNDEKAKAYEMALEAARKELGVDRKEWEVVKRVLCNIFPELAESESEDKRIIEEIKFAVIQMPSERQDTKDRCLAWLEKQKEQKPADNPKWAELTWKDINELERIINNVHYEFQNGIGEDSFGELVLERFREYKEDEDTDEKEQKPVEYPAGFYVTFPDGKKYYTKEMRCNNMKIKVVEPKPVEWSEEDEEMLKNVLFVLESYVSRSESASSPSLITTYPTYYKEIDWLKSLRRHWKPTEEQMEALQRAIDACESEWAYQDDELRSLLNELKKLM